MNKCMLFYCFKPSIHLCLGRAYALVIPVDMILPLPSLPIPGRQIGLGCRSPNFLNDSPSLYPQLKIAFQRCTCFLYNILAYFHLSISAILILFKLNFQNIFLSCPTKMHIFSYSYFIKFYPNFIVILRLYISFGLAVIPQLNRVIWSLAKPPPRQLRNGTKEKISGFTKHIPLLVINPYITPQFKASGKITLERRRYTEFLPINQTYF